jgi:hypothetical protein
MCDSPVTLSEEDMRGTASDCSASPAAAPTETRTQYTLQQTSKQLSADFKRSDTVTRQYINFVNAGSGESHLHRQHEVQRSLQRVPSWQGLLQHLR